MKKIKVLAVITAAIMLFGVYFTSAFAFGDGLNALGEYFGLSGGNNGGNANSDDPDANDDVESTNGKSQVNLDSGFSSILQGVLGSASSALTDSQLTDILNNFDINALLGGDSEVINEVLDLIGANQPSKSSSNDDDDDDSGNSGNKGSQSSTPSNTAPQYTNVYVTEAPAVTYSYTPGTTAANGATTLPGETTTGIGETTTLYYVAPSTIYAEQITTLPYDYQVDATEAEAKDGVTLKMIIGVSILLISGVAVVGVALSLKKSKV